ncbi:hypothetical protein [Nocardioides sp.]|uniref:hypothetical protein n=1 Tax=Nocardioides sp. TaxID=35761 RepID=UPI00262B0FF7|nr:hypothetical protein [Nocardioides sp.]
MSPRVPRSLLIASAGVCLAGVVMLVWGAIAVGVTTDEPIHVERFTSYLHTGWYVADFQSRDGVPLPGVSDQYVYGPATMWLLHHWTVLWGGEPHDGVAVTAHAYALRHLGVALIALVGVGAVAATARMILRRWSWGLVAAACLLATPMFLGHAMFNVKDPAVATGYALVTAALVAWTGRGAQRPVRRCATVLVLTAGVWLMLGTRPGMWVALACSLVATVVLTLVRRRAPGEHTPRWLDLGGALVLAWVGLALLYPEVFTHPAAMLRHSAEGSANFLGFAGSRLFVPVRMLLLMPLLLLAALTCGTVVAVARLVRARLRADASTVRLAIVGVQLVALPIASMVRRTGLYTDLRQLLFIIPAAAVLAAVGIAWTLGRLGGARRRHRIAAALATAAVVVPTIDAASLFPFTYAYANPLVGALGWQSIAPGDFYQASKRDLAGLLPARALVVCNPLTDAEGRALPYATLAANADCRTDRSGLLHPYTSGATEPGARTFLALVSGDRRPTNCEPQAAVVRRHAWRRWVLSSLETCTVPTATLQAGVGRTETEVMGFLAQGWGLELRARSATAVLAFALEQPGRVVVRLDVAGRSLAGMQVDGRAMPVPADGTITLPGLATGTHRIVLQAAPGRSLDVTLTSLAFAPV